MIDRRRPIILFMLGIAALAACAPAGPFPSLAMRPEERLVSVGEPRRPMVATPADAALRQRATSLLAEGRSGARAFESGFDAADRATRNPGRMGSESWISAQLALSRLEAARSNTTIALGALDRLATEHADLPTNADDYAFILEAKRELERLTAEQQARLDRLRSRISG
ncbi:MAG: hypothetical protein AB7O91_06290 [Sphingomonas sp.]